MRRPISARRLYDRVRHQPIQTNTGERHREHPEQPRQASEEKGLRIQAVDLFVLRAHVEDRERRTDVPHRLTDRVDDRPLTVEGVSGSDPATRTAKLASPSTHWKAGKIDRGGRASLGGPVYLASRATPTTSTSLPGADPKRMECPTGSSPLK